MESNVFEDTLRAKFGKRTLLSLGTVIDQKKACQDAHKLHVYLMTRTSILTAGLHTM